MDTECVTRLKWLMALHANIILTRGIDSETMEAFKTEVSCYGEPLCGLTQDLMETTENLVRRV